MRTIIRWALLGTAMCVVLAAPALAREGSPAAGAALPHYQERVFPPWRHGANNDVANRGFDFTIPEVDDLADFHGDPATAKLVLYVGGNYYFAMAPLVQAFEAEHPEYRGRIYWETIPPGLLVQQMQAGGTITVGNMTWTAKPDAYLAGLAKVNLLIGQGLLTGPAVPYVTNDLTIMVPQGNPAHIASLADLARPGVRLTMPNPAFEGIARQIKQALDKAGTGLANTVYDSKVKDGTTILTHIHHRQTPLFLMQGLADAGVTWQSEAVFQEQIGHPIQHVAIGAAVNATAIYAGAEIKGAAHPQAAEAWLSFIRSPAALHIFERYGFKPYGVG
ncbi:MAG TPA: substrate-binding domain-containing protein [Acetobacteraceae bacterium]|jgi:ABC-type molybdate transport system substrate-binding protein|nr:substrate-binding domain-containing protein [Acetobacteraceae bacterium]